MWDSEADSGVRFWGGFWVDSGVVSGVGFWGGFRCAGAAALVPLRWCRCASVDYEVYSTMDSGKILEWILGGFLGVDSV